MTFWRRPLCHRWLQRAWARRRRLALTAGAALALIVVALRLTASTPPVVAEPVPIAAQLHAAHRSPAGRPLTVVMTLARGVAARSATLAAEGAMGTFTLHAPVNQGQARFVIPPRVTDTAQQLILQAQAGPCTAHTVVAIIPGPPATHMTPLPGAKSIVVGGTRTQIIGEPEDWLGNPVSEGTRIALRIMRPNQGVITRTGTVRDLLATVYIASQRLVGPDALASRWQTARGGQAAINETAAPPVDLRVDRSAVATIPADGHTLVTLDSGPLHDRFGNLVPDGTAVQFLLSGALGKTIVPAQAISGTATAVIRAPQQPGALLVRLASYGSVSAPATITFRPTVSTHVPVSITWGRRGLVVTVGPVVNAIGAWVADGTVVRVSAHAGAVSSSGAEPTRDGSATVILPISPEVHGRLTIEAGGHTQHQPLALWTGR